MLNRDSYANRRYLGFRLDWPTRSNFRSGRSDLDNGLKGQTFENNRRMGNLHLNGGVEVMPSITLRQVPTHLRCCGKCRDRKKQYQKPAEITEPQKALCSRPASHSWRFKTHNLAAQKKGMFFPEYSTAIFRFYDGLDCKARRCFR